MVRGPEPAADGTASRPELVLIAGPTASGKSALALRLAERLPVEIINADSMQVYRELRILTARPGEAEEACCAHRLYGTVPATERYSVGRWLGDAATAIASVRQAGRVPVVVGGTGLYFDALINGIAEIPEVPGDLQEALQADLKRIGIAGLRTRLAARDAHYGSEAHALDPQRVVRALGVIEATGRSLKGWQSDPVAGPPVDPGRTVRLIVSPGREELAGRIERRCVRMLADGALEEVRRLRLLGLDPRLPAMKAIGVPELGAVLDGTVSTDDALRDMATATRRYAKRQRTWMRGRMADWTWFDQADAADILSLDRAGSQP